MSVPALAASVTPWPGMRSESTKRTASTIGLSGHAPGIDNARASLRRTSRSIAGKESLFAMTRMTCSSRGSTASQAAASHAPRRSASRYRGLDVAVDVELLDRDRALLIEGPCVLVGEAEGGDERGGRPLLFGIERSVGGEDRAQDARGERAESPDALDVLFARLRREERAEPSGADFERHFFADDFRHRHPDGREDRRHRARELDEPVVELFRHAVEAMPGEDRGVRFAAPPREPFEHARATAAGEGEDRVFAERADEPAEHVRLGIGGRSVRVVDRHRATTLT